MIRYCYQYSSKYKVIIQGQNKVIDYQGEQTKKNDILVNLYH